MRVLKKILNFLGICHKCVTSRPICQVACLRLVAFTLVLGDGQHFCDLGTKDIL